MGVLVGSTCVDSELGEVLSLLDVEPGFVFVFFGESADFEFSEKGPDEVFEGGGGEGIVLEGGLEGGLEEEGADQLELGGFF